MAEAKSLLGIPTNIEPTASPGPTNVQRKRAPADFDMGDVLGEGSFATVIIAKEKSTGRNFAIKMLDKKHIIKEKKIEYVNTEKQCFNQINHVFFVRLYYTFQDVNKLYFVLGYAANGELLQFIRRLGSFDLNCTTFYAAEILCAIEYLHSIGIIHRDLKPENILLSQSMHIKITDFGTAKILSESDRVSDGRVRANSFVGTAEYVSPELLTDKSACMASDIWALGCIIYQLLAGQPPFNGGNEYQTFQKITKLDYSIPEGFPDAASDIVKRILVLDPDKRFGCKTMGGYDVMKSHEFFSSINFEDLAKQVAPVLLPYLPAGGGEPELRSLYKSETNLGDFKNFDSTSSGNVSGSFKSLENGALEGRDSAIAMQIAESRWHGFVDDNELIIKAGLVNKRKGFFSKKRGLILTDRPRFLYVDYDKAVVKGEIPWSASLRTEFKNSKIFFVHTPSRTYYLEDTSGGAQSWVDSIRQVIDKTTA